VEIRALVEIVDGSHRFLRLHGAQRHG
jgi:hypothetical protein